VAGHDIIVVGASAGGVEALQVLVTGLPADLPAAVFVVLHMSPDAPSSLPQILDRAGPLPVTPATDNAPILPGRIYVAVPDQHLLIERDRVCLVRGPKENRTRPAVDPLFRSAARDYGPRVIGLILTGALDDGTSGLQAIKGRGGLAVVQDPAEALYAGMPRSAAENVAVDYCMPLAEIPALLARLVAEPAPEESAYAVPPNLDLEVRIAELDMDPLNKGEVPGTPSVFACPECHGTLWETQDGNLLHFRCRVGHAYSAESMLAEHDEGLETALWWALRALEESTALAKRMAASARERNHPLLVTRYEQKAHAQEQHAVLIREILNGDKRVKVDQLA
jgi:two-component system, chemotaxis family, protein-glutamate methylesterase/glutaminase